MKKVFHVLFLLTAGFFTGIFSSMMYIAFIPRYGDIDSGMVSNIVAWSFGCSVLFAIAGIISFRKYSLSLLNTFLVFAILSFAVMIPSVSLYFYRLHGEYSKLLHDREARTKMEFTDMAIATRPVQGWSDASYGKPSPSYKIKKWERCALGYRRCDTKPRQVEAICRRSTVNINESDWPAFSRIPEEDFPHTDSRSVSMKLCEER